MDKATYTYIGPCTPNGMAPPMCPPGWKSVGLLPNSCDIGNVPGIGQYDAWRQQGYQRVCKKTIESSGDLAVDCCTNSGGIQNSVECKTANWKPYSKDCNNVMQGRCNTNIQKDPYAHNFNGMPFGQNGPVISPCTGKLVQKEKYQPQVKVDKYCSKYLANAPVNSFYYSHDYTDYPYYFPNYSYVTPGFAGSYGYYPRRVPYYTYNDRKHLYNHNSVCRFNPEMCNHFNQK